MESAREQPTNKSTSGPEHFRLSKAIFRGTHERSTGGNGSCSVSGDAAGALAANAALASDSVLARLAELHRFNNLRDCIEGRRIKKKRTSFCLAIQSFLFCFCFLCVFWAHTKRTIPKSIQFQMVFCFLLLYLACYFQALSVHICRTGRANINPKRKKPRSSLAAQPMVS